MKTLANTQKLQLASGRAWVSSAALLSFLFLSAAPLNAKGGNPEGAIVGTSADLEDLIVTVVWPDSVANDWREIAVFDENDVQLAGQPVWPSPGERVQATFANFLHRLPASGFQFSATVRDAVGRDVSTRHAFRVVLECPPGTEPCRWRTQDGVYTNALAISEPLMTALDGLEPRSIDLLADTLEERPDLRGPVLSLAAQLDRLDQELDLEDECFCAWYHSSKRDPNSQDCALDDSEKKTNNDGNYGWEYVWFEGVGARASVAGQMANYPSPELATVSGRSEQTLELRCWRIIHRQEATHLPMLSAPGAPLRTIQFPTVVPCPDSCRGTVESLASIDFEFSARAQEPESNSAMDALAIADAALERDDGVHDPPKGNTWQDWLQWQSGDTKMEHGGSAQIPEHGEAEDNDIVRLTATLSVNATVDFEAEAENAWGYATASIWRTLLRLEGHATCALLPDREAELVASPDSPDADDCGELQIEPWVD